MAMVLLRGTGVLPCFVGHRMPVHGMRHEGEDPSTIVSVSRCTGTVTTIGFASLIGHRQRWTCSTVATMVLSTIATISRDRETLTESILFM
jgi:hypothetical protein